MSNNPRLVQEKFMRDLFKLRDQTISTKIDFSDPEYILQTRDNAARYNLSPAAVERYKKDLELNKDK